MTDFNPSFDDDGPDLDHSELRDLLDGMLQTERETGRMITLKVSALAAPVMAEILRLGIRIFTASSRDVEVIEELDDHFHMMNSAADLIDQFEADGEGDAEMYREMIAKAPPTLHEWRKLSAEQREDERRAHKTMKMLAFAEVSTIPEEVETEILRLAAETGTVTTYHLPPTVVEQIDNFWEWRKERDGERPDVGVMLFGEKDAVRQFAKEHKLLPSDADENLFGAGDDSDE